MRLKCYRNCRWWCTRRRRRGGRTLRMQFRLSTRSFVQGCRTRRTSASRGRIVLILLRRVAFRGRMRLSFMVLRRRSITHILLMLKAMLVLLLLWRRVERRRVRLRTLLPLLRRRVRSSIRSLLATRTAALLAELRLLLALHLKLRALVLARAACCREALTVVVLLRLRIRYRSVAESVILLCRFTGSFVVLVRGMVLSLSLSVCRRRRLAALV